MDKMKYILIVSLIIILCYCVSTDIIESVIIIEGHVYNEDAVPLENVVVEIIKITGSPGKNSSENKSRNMTGNTGGYHLSIANDIKIRKDIFGKETLIEYIDFIKIRYFLKGYKEKWEEIHFKNPGNPDNMIEKNIILEKVEKIRRKK